MICIVINFDSNLTDWMVVGTHVIHHKDISFHLQQKHENFLVLVFSIPVVLYGAEAWTLRKKEEQALLIFESKIFRRIYGPKYENGKWKSQMNQELEEMSKGENIVKWIKGKRIRQNGGG